MSTGGLSKARLGRMHDVIGGYVERGEVPGIVTLVEPRRRGARRGDRRAGAGGGDADAARHDLPHRLDDQADHRGRRR